MYTTTISTTVSYLTYQEAANKLGVSISMIRHYVERGLLTVHTEDIWGQYTYTVPNNTKYLIPLASFEKFKREYVMLRMHFHKPGRKTGKITEVLV